MRLNPDCIRDILLTLDQLIVPNEYGLTDEILPEELCSHQQLSCYTQNEILYTVRHLFDEGMLKKGKLYVHESIPHIADITAKGYTFIDTAKSPTAWEKVKSHLITKGLEVSATALYNIAINFALNLNP